MGLRPCRVAVGRQARIDVAPLYAVPPHHAPASAHDRLDKSENTKQNETARIRDGTSAVKTALRCPPEPLRATTNALKYPLPAEWNNLQSNAVL
jgi:hypothetical protein